MKHMMKSWSMYINFGGKWSSAIEFRSDLTIKNFRKFSCTDSFFLVMSFVKCSSILYYSHIVKI